MNLFFSFKLIVKSIIVGCFFGLITLLSFISIIREVRGKAFTGSFFGPGDGFIGYNKVKCNGSEIDLMHCKLQDLTAPICDHSHEAGVACECKY